MNGAEEGEMKCVEWTEQPTSLGDNLVGVADSRQSEPIIVRHQSEEKKSRRPPRPKKAFCPPGRSKIGA